MEEGICPPPSPKLLSSHSSCPVNHMVRRCVRCKTSNLLYLTLKRPLRSPFWRRGEVFSAHEAPRRRFREHLVEARSTVLGAAVVMGCYDVVWGCSALWRREGEGEVKDVVLLGNMCWFMKQGGRSSWLSRLSSPTFCVQHDPR